MTTPYKRNIDTHGLPNVEEYDSTEPHLEFAQVIHGMWLAVNAAYAVPASKRASSAAVYLAKQQAYQDVLGHLGYQILRGELAKVEA